MRYMYEKTTQPHPKLLLLDCLQGKNELIPPDVYLFYFGKTFYLV